MSSRQEKPQPLSEADIESIAAEVGRGGQPMVWFTSLAIGVEEGRSGKVVTLGNPDEGDFVHVKPTGSRDVLSFSPTEVTLTKPAPKRAAEKPAQPKPAAAANGKAAPPTAAAHPEPELATSTPAEPKPTAEPNQTAAEPDSSKASSPASRPAARKAKPAETTVTLLGSVDGEWTVEVQNGKTKTVRGLPVPGSAVAQAAKALHPEVHDAIESVLEAARGAQRARVEHLQAELAEAQRMLNELSEE